MERELESVSKLKKTWVAIGVITALVLAPLVAGLGGSSSLVTGDSTEGFVGAQSLVKNGGFEMGTRNWTASAGSFATSSSSPLRGNLSATWDASAASQTLISDSVTIPAGLQGKNGVATCSFKCASGTCTHTLTADDGSTNLLTPVTITSSTTSAPRTTVNFIFPSSGGIRLKITSAADEPSVKIDDCLIADASFMNIGGVQVVTDWVAYTPTFTNLPVTITVASYRRVGDSVEVQIDATATGAATGNISVSIPPVGNIDTTKYNSSSNAVGHVFAGIGVNNWGGNIQAISTTTVRMSTEGSSGAAWAATVPGTWANGSTLSLHFLVPIAGWTANGSAYKPDQAPASWSGYHDSTCSWARTNSSYGDPTADSTCVFTERQNRNFGTVTSYLSSSDKLPGVVFTPPRVGRYWVCAFTQEISASTANAGFELSDTNSNVIAEVGIQTTTNNIPQNITLCGLYNASSTASTTIRIRDKSSTGTLTLGQNGSGGNAVEWTIVDLDAPMAAPYLVNSVVNDYAGVTRTCSAYVTFSGGTPSVTSNDCAASVTDNGTGDTTVTWTTAFSSRPRCVAILDDRASIGASGSTLNVTGIYINTSAAGSVRLLTWTGGAATGSFNTAAFDLNFDVSCIGPR